MATRRHDIATRLWGSSYWRSLYATARSWPDRATPTQRTTGIEYLITVLSDDGVLPCVLCRRHAAAWVRSRMTDDRRMCPCGRVPTHGVSIPTHCATCAPGDAPGDTVDLRRAYFNDVVRTRRSFLSMLYELHNSVSRDHSGGAVYDARIQDALQTPLSWKLQDQGPRYAPLLLALPWLWSFFKNISNVSMP